MESYLRQQKSRKALHGEIAQESVQLFADHHREELRPQYWIEHTGCENPTNEQIVQTLMLRGSWGFNDSEFFDYALPDDASPYVLCVHFDEDGNVDEVSMES